MERIRTVSGRYVPDLTTQEWGVVMHALRVAAEVFDNDRDVFWREETKARQADNLGLSHNMARAKQAFIEQAKESRDLADWLEDHT